MGSFRCGSSPRCIVVERQALLAVGTVGVVLALADLLSLNVHSRAVNAFVCVAVALAARTNRDISNRIEIRLQHLLVTEKFITESVQAIQRYSDVGSGDPLLKLVAVLEIVCTWSALQRRERNVTELQRGDITVLAGA